MDRRAFIKNTLKLGIGLSVAQPLSALSVTIEQGSLSFYHTHTGESFDLCLIDGYCSALDKQNLFRFLRDFRTGEVHPMDLKLFNTLKQIQQLTGSTGTYQVISGYRSPATNELLRSQSNGVAKKSYHMKGQAIDVRLTDLPTRELRDAAREVGSGGVGYYSRSDFVHIDTGPKRFW